jgi:pyridoxine 5-phosphate synthase
MTRLSVNVNKVATLRNARGGNLPNLVAVVQDCERFGAEGITVHPRPDERHVKRSDVYALKDVVTTEFNIEGYPSPEFIQLVLHVKPHQVTLVPDPPDAITSSQGWDTQANLEFLKQVIGTFKDAGIRTSIFLDTQPKHMEYAAKTLTDRIELYTGPYAAAFDLHPEQAVLGYANAAKHATELNLGLNAGHDLNLRNLRYFMQHTQNLLEVSIGHALICDALYFGLENTINMYKRELR